MFQDISKMQSRAACRRAAITSSSSSLCLAAKARALIRQSSRYDPSWMRFSIALTGFGFADCRKELKRVSVSLRSFMARIGLIAVTSHRVAKKYGKQATDALNIPLSDGHSFSLNVLLFRTN